MPEAVNLGGADEAPPDLFSKLDSAEALLVAANCSASLLLPQGTPIILPAIRTGPQKEKSLAVWVPPLEPGSRPFRFAVLEGVITSALIVAPPGTVLRCRTYDKHGLPEMAVYVQWTIPDHDLEDEDQDETRQPDRQDD